MSTLLKDSENRYYIYFYFEGRPHIRNIVYQVILFVLMFVICIKQNNTQNICAFLSVMVGIEYKYYLKKRGGIPAHVFDTTFCDENKLYQWLVAGWLFSQCTNQLEI